MGEYDLLKYKNQVTKFTDKWSILLCFYVLSNLIDKYMAIPGKDTELVTWIYEKNIKYGCTFLLSQFSVFCNFSVSSIFLISKIFLGGGWEGGKQSKSSLW